MAIRITTDGIQIGEFTLGETTQGLSFDGVALYGGQKSEFVIQGSNFGYTVGGFAPSFNTVGTIGKFPFAIDSNSRRVSALSNTARNGAGTSSQVNGYVSGSTGSVFFPPTPNAFDNTIQKFPFATDVTISGSSGLLTQVVGYSTGISSATHGYTAGGKVFPPSAQTNVIERFPFSADKLSSDVGDLATAVSAPSSSSSTTHGYLAGGYVPPGSTHSNVIQKFPFAVSSNASDVGDLAVGIYAASGQQSTTHGYQSGGFHAPGKGLSSSSISIRKYSFSSDGNSTNVGVLSQGRAFNAASTSTTHGYNAGGWTGPPDAISFLNTIDKFPFATDTNSSDVGDGVYSLLGSTGHQI